MNLRSRFASLLFIAVALIVTRTGEAHVAQGTLLHGAYDLSPSGGVVVGGDPNTILVAGKAGIRLVDVRTATVTSVLDPRAGPIMGDPDRLQQVLWNLLTNAIKFTPRGGRVQVFLTRVNSHVEIRVSDTGVGIPSDLLPYVFERFVQGDSRGGGSQRGLGLGLALVRHLVEQHGGAIRAESPGPGLGATFVVRLPLMIHAPRAGVDAVESGAPPPPRLDVSGPASLYGLRIVVVDDDPDAVELLSRILGVSGAEVRACGSVAEALEALAGWDPHVLVSDIEMPGEDGYSLIRRFRALEPPGRDDASGQRHADLPQCTFLCGRLGRSRRLSHDAQNQPIARDD